MKSFYIVLLAFLPNQTFCQHVLDSTWANKYLSPLHHMRPAKVEYIESESAIEMLGKYALSLPKYDINLDKQWLERFKTVPRNTTVLAGILVGINHKTEYEDLENLARTIAKLESPHDQIAAVLTFGGKWHAKDQRFFDSVAKRIANSQSSISSQIESYIPIGDFYFDRLEYDKAAKTYLQILSEANPLQIAYINEKMGAAYTIVDDPKFLKTANECYESAKSNYLSINDSLNYYWAGLRQANIIFESSSQSSAINTKFVEFFLKAMKYSINNKPPNGYNYSLYSTLGKYFFLRIQKESYRFKEYHISDFESSKRFYLAALYAAIEDSNTTLSCNSLLKLSYLYMSVGDVENATIDLHNASILNELITDSYTKELNYLTISDVKHIRGFSSEEARPNLLRWLNNTPNSRLSENQIQFLEMFAYGIYLRHYQDSGKINNMPIFEKKYDSLLEKFSTLLNDVATIEFNYWANRDANTINFKDYQIASKDSVIGTRERLLSQLNSEVLKRQDSLSKLRMNILKASKDLRNQESRLKTTKFWLYTSGAFLAFLVLALIVVWRISHYFLKVRDRKILESQIKIKNTQMEMKSRLDISRADAKSKVHNLKNSFQKFLIVLKIKNSTEAQSYAQTCATYYRTVLNKWDWLDEKWTLADEKNMLSLFLVTENVLDKDIEIVWIHDGIDLKTTRFESEIFTTLLHNSIKYAFKKNNKKFVFKINLLATGNILNVEVSDNGRPGEPEDYLDFDGEDSGLKIVKRKIEAIAYLSSAMNGIKDIFVIEPLKGIGTTIKLKIPHEKIEGINC